MLVSYHTEMWVQGFYLNTWTDLEKAPNIVELKRKLRVLQEKRPDGTFRMIERQIREELLE